MLVALQSIALSLYEETDEEEGFGSPNSYFLGNNFLMPGPNDH